MKYFWFCVASIIFIPHSVVATAMQPDGIFAILKSKNYIKNCDGKINVGCISAGKDVKPKKITEVSSWNTYSYDRYTSISNKKKSELKIIKLGKIDPAFTNTYGYINKNGFFVEKLDSESKQKYEISSGDAVKYPLEKNYNNNRYLNENEVHWDDRFSKRAFETISHIFEYNSDSVLACDKKTNDCKSIRILYDTYPYMYANDGLNVVVSTNYGELLGFINGDWCYMDADGDEYTCANRKDFITQPKPYQFYSSLTANGIQFIGQYPNGIIYHFKSGKIAPFHVQPIDTANNKNYEAQSMAYYCGDVYVGFWPKAELYKYNLIEDKWEFIYRFFDKNDYEDTDDNIPFGLRDPDGLPRNYFGQRITALVPYRESLYVFTANKNSEYDNPTLNYEDPLFSDYGSIYRLYMDGCFTTRNLK